MKIADEPEGPEHRRVEEMLPRHSVASQLRIFTPVGTAITIELSMKKMSSPSGRPTANMWCAQTSSEKNAMPTVEYATAL